MIRIDGTTITMPRGDTGLVAFSVTGYETSSEVDRGVFALYGDSRELFRRVLRFTDNMAVLSLANEDTQDLPAGDYQWDFRVVAGAVIEVKDGVEDVTDGVSVDSPFALAGKLPKFKLKEVGAHV